MRFVELIREPWFVLLTLGLFMIALGGIPALWLRASGFAVHGKLMWLVVGGVGCSYVAPVAYFISRDG
jgi:hypothetical protein